MKQRIYIAGPMRGIKSYNFPAFDAARDWLNSIGFEAVSPADIDREHNIDESFKPDDITPEFLCAVASRDVAAVLSCDALYMLSGWEKSKGAVAERAVAEWVGKKVYLQEEGITHKQVETLMSNRTVQAIVKVGVDILNHNDVAVRSNVESRIEQSFPENYSLAQARC